MHWICCILILLTNLVCSSTSDDHLDGFASFPNITNLQTPLQIQNNPKYPSDVVFLPRPSVRRMYAGLAMWNSAGDFPHFNALKSLRALTGDSTAVYESVSFSVCKYTLLGYSKASIQEMIPHTSQEHWRRWVGDGLSLIHI